MDILYKVVKGVDRSSIFAEGRYRRTYELGEIVVALPHSFGLMCFKKLDDAEYFNLRVPWRSMIIKVEALAEVREAPKDLTTPVCVSEYSLDYFYTYPGSKAPATVGIPKGTVFCHKIRVLD